MVDVRREAVRGCGSNRKMMTGSYEIAIRGNAERMNVDVGSIYQKCDESLRRMVCRLRYTKKARRIWKACQLRFNDSRGDL